MADMHPGVNGPAVERANLIVEEHIELGPRKQLLNELPLAK